MHENAPPSTHSLNHHPLEIHCARAVTRLALLVAHRGIVQRHTNRAPVMPIILPDDTLTAQLPQPCIVITTCSDEIRAVSTESAVPDPALVAVQGSLEREGGGVAFRGGGQGVAGLYVVGRGEVDAPDARGVVRGAGGEVPDVWREEDAGDVGVVGEELADGDDGGQVATHDHFPDVDVALGRGC